MHVEIRGTQGCALVGDPERAVGEYRDVAKAQPCVPLISTMHGQPFLISLTIYFMMDLKTYISQLAWRCYPHRVGTVFTSIRYIYKYIFSYSGTVILQVDNHHIQRCPLHYNLHRPCWTVLAQEALLTQAPMTNEDNITSIAFMTWTIHSILKWWDVINNTYTKFNTAFFLIIISHKNNGM